MLTFAQLKQFPLLPTYNPSTHCHDLTLTDENLTFAICLQRASNKQHPFHLYTAPSFCSKTYPPNGHLVDFISLSSSTIELLFQSLINLLNTKSSHINLPEPNFFWINSNFTQNLTSNKFLCPNQCQGKNHSGQLLILKTRCQYDNSNRPCITTKQTHWDRAPFICLTNQIIKQEKPIPPESIRLPSNYSSDTIIFYDSTRCLIVRTRTHQYTFCFRRQSCSQSQTSAFCTTKSQAYHICYKEKNKSNLLTIENDNEYQFINNIISHYSDETLLNSDGLIKNKHAVRAQWMWIDGMKGLNGIYQWNTSENSSIPIIDKYWCNSMTNCSGGKGHDHVVLNIVCQSNNKALQVCLASRRQSEPGPFICKRALKENEESVSNYILLKDLNTTTTTTTFTPVTSVFQKNLTIIYYDEQHCLTVETYSHIYTFCLRRQNCTLTKAYCTKWNQAQKNCMLLKNQAELLTIDNEQERELINDIIKKYSYETRLTFNGGSYRYYYLADFIWIDGFQQADSQTYLWKNGLESIPNHLWCPKNECLSTDHERVVLNLACHKNNSLICLSTRAQWKLAPYICKRTRPKDQCPIIYDKFHYNHSNEMLIITINRSTITIKCKHPDYSKKIKMEYLCDIQTKQWKLIYENKNFTCPIYDIPLMAEPTQDFQSSQMTTISTSTYASYLISNTSITIKDQDCSQSEFSSLISRLPAESRYIYPYKLPIYSSLYYDIKLACYFNNSIQITYRCDLLTKKWIYVYGNTNRFSKCYPPCNNNERNELLNKYFTKYEQRNIRVKYIRKNKSLRLRCFNTNENRWKSINYQCGTMSITKYQWFALHSCFQTTLATTITTTTTVALPTVMVSLTITQLPPSCPPAVVHGSPCDYAIGQYILDRNGCVRKVCPSISRLCNTIRCPPDRICRVIPCKSCIHTDYIQAVCEYLNKPSLCDFEKQLFLYTHYESINHWERQTIAVVQQYAKEQRERIKSRWPSLTIN